MNIHPVIAQRFESAQYDRTKADISLDKAHKIGALNLKSGYLHDLLKSKTPD
jgi:hypothetical protein